MGQFCQKWKFNHSVLIHEKDYSLRGVYVYMLLDLNFFIPNTDKAYNVIKVQMIYVVKRMTCIISHNTD
jgi:hypothetical protein